jgi:2,4-dienoyl-CoA reductase-like NADH-dependent reductase (Old Yellow Enzyme family)
MTNTSAMARGYEPAPVARPCVPGHREATVDALGYRRDGGAMSDPFLPAQLGPLTLRNRVIKAATSEGRSPHGMVTDDLIAFHRMFADGGVGMTTVAYCCVSPQAASAPGQIVMSVSALPGLRRLTEAVHQGGSAISAQLGHAGVVAPRKLTGVTAVAPSRFVNPTSMAYCRAISVEEIRTVIAQFGSATRVAIDAGFDAVELHFGHLYLPSSFLSPLINRRRDGYGGSIDNRSRLVREIAAHVRDIAGDQIAVIAKLDMDDGMPGGIWIDEALRTAQLLDDDATLDALELTQGSSVYKPMYLFRGDVPVKEFSTVMPPALRPAVRLFGRQAMGVYPYRDLYMLAAARQFVPLMKNTKLILLGGITDREHVETGLAEGFDFVAMGRALLREPDRVKTMIAEPGSRSRCTHNNKCMVTVFGRTHCVLDPVQRYGQAGMPIALLTEQVT